MRAPFRPMLALLGPWVLLACQRPGAATHEAQTSAVVAPATTVPAAVASAPPPDTRPWREALAAPDDALLLARLAEAEGAAGLLEVIEAGGAGAPVALAALPLAEDADLAAEPLGRRLRAASPSELGLLLGALEGVALRPRRATEPPATAGFRGAHEALVALAGRAELPAPLRARCVSVARLLQERFPPPYLPLPTTFDR